MNEPMKLLHILCPHCKVTNRVPPARLLEQPKCGKCHLALFTARAIELNAADFEQHVATNEIPLLVDFWAPWCGPCRAMAPAYEQATAVLEPKVRLAKVNTEIEQALANRFGIRSIPTLIIFRKGREVARQAGAMGAQDIVRWATSVLT